MCTLVQLNVNLGWYKRYASSGLGILLLESRETQTSTLAASLHGLHRSLIFSNRTRTPTPHTPVTAPHTPQRQPSHSHRRQNTVPKAKRHTHAQRTNGNATDTRRAQRAHDGSYAGHAPPLRLLPSLNMGHAMQIHHTDSHSHTVHDHMTCDNMRRALARTCCLPDWTSPPSARTGTPA